MKQLATAQCLLLFSYQLSAQSEVPSPIIFIYDASGSLWGQIQGKTKMEIAREVLPTNVNNHPSTQKVGYIAYSHS